MHITLEKCNSTTLALISPLLICHSDTEISDALNNAQLNIIVANSYLDFSDYGTPIKQITDDQNTFTIVDGFQKLIRLYVKYNTAELSDNIFNYGIGGTDQRDFYSLEKTYVDLKPLTTGDDTLMYVVFAIDAEEDSYSRSVFTFLDLTGQVGGLQEIFNIAGALIVGFFTEKLLSLSLVSQLYTYQSSSKTETDVRTFPKLKTQKAEEFKQPTFKEENFALASRLKSKLNFKKSKEGDPNLLDISPEYSHNSKKKTQPNLEIKNDLQKTILKRKKLDFSLSDYFKQLCCCKCSSKHKQLEIGEKRVLDELD